jgi:3-polyprenyl-4-hydroxybenzoate decarboxylase
MIHRNIFKSSKKVQKMFSQLPDFLKKEGDLIEIERELSPTFEIPAAVKIKPNLPGKG